MGATTYAVSTVVKAVELNPKRAEAHISLGQLFILRKDFGKAKSHLNKALDLDPGNEKVIELLKGIL